MQMNKKHWDHKRDWDHWINMRFSHLSCTHWTRKQNMTEANQRDTFTRMSSFFFRLSSPNSSCCFFLIPFLCSLTSTHSSFSNFLKTCCQKKMLQNTDIVKAVSYRTPPLLLHSFSLLPAVGWEQQCFSHIHCLIHFTPTHLFLISSCFLLLSLPNSLNACRSGTAFEQFWMRG